MVSVPDRSSAVPGRVARERFCSALLNIKPERMPSARPMATSRSDLRVSEQLAAQIRASAHAPTYETVAGIGPESVNRDDDVSRFPSGLNIPMGFSDLLQGIGAVNDRLELSCLNKIEQ